MQSVKTSTTANKHPTYGISTPIKILAAITAVLAVGVLGFGEYSRYEKAEAKKLAVKMRDQEAATKANQKKIANDAAWPQKRAEIERQNIIAARQRDEEYRQNQHANAVFKIKGVLVRFYDLSRVADVSQPAALAGIIPQLQAIHRETQHLGITDCMAPAQTAIASAFEETINAYLARMQARAEAVQQHSFKAQAALDQYKAIEASCT